MRLPAPVRSICRNVTLIGGDSAPDRGNGVRTFNGVMDEVAIFNYALTQSEILNLYFNAAGGSSAGGCEDRYGDDDRVFADTTVTLSAGFAAGLDAFSAPVAERMESIYGRHRNATLVLTQAVVTNSGSYDVVVGNGSEPTRVRRWCCTVDFPRSAGFSRNNRPPSSSNNYSGGLVTFTAAVNGTPPIQLQWRHDGM